MALFQTHYQIKRFGSWYCFFGSESVITIDTEDSQYSDVDIVFFDIIDEELEFLCDLMKQHGRDWFSFSLLCSSCSEKAAQLINKWVSMYFSKQPFFCYTSISLALQTKWDERFKVAALYCEDNAYYVNGLNAGSLPVGDYKTIIPYAKKLAENIKELDLTQLEQIIWIDNWMQKNIQYIKNRETSANGEIYICEKIEKQAVVTDVFKNHFGVCEDISASIAAILYFLDITFEVLQGNGHAWLLVEVEGNDYLWDCTHNITRNPNRVHEALKASEYSHSFTLIGQNDYISKYNDFGILGFAAKDTGMSKMRIEEVIKRLSEQHHVQFVYGDYCPYDSWIKTQITDV